MTESTEQVIEERVCGACGAIFLGKIPTYAKVSRGPDIPIDRFKLQVCSKTVKPNCLTNSLQYKTVVNTTVKPEKLIEGRLTAEQVHEIATSIAKSQGIKLLDKLVTLKWIQGARKELPNVYFPFHPTTVINGITLSISLYFIECIEEAYLEFLVPELVKDVDLTDLEFEVLEGGKVVAIGVFK